jgi:2-oxoglutarate ferredoxin oxidoreductase subunit beta
VVSDELLSPETVKQMGVDFFHVNRGYAIPFGTGLKLGNLDLKVIVLISDLLTLSGNHFLHSARGNIDLVVVCLNHFLYRKVGGENPRVRYPRVSPSSLHDDPFNIPHLAKSLGAVYVARWTMKHSAELANSLSEAIKTKGFSVIEVILPGGDYHLGQPCETDVSELLDYYHRNSKIRHGADTQDARIGEDKKIIVGRFVRRKRELFIDAYNRQLQQNLEDRFREYQ